LDDDILFNNILIYNIYFFYKGVTLDKENPTITWSFDEEEDDTDFLIHTLFLKQVRKFDSNCKT